MKKTGRVIIKGTLGASGSSLFIAKNNTAGIENALKQIRKRKDNHIYLVEVLLELTCSPNILLYISPNDGPIYCIGVTDQRLDEHRAHLGNIYPSTAKRLTDMIRSAIKIGQRLQSKGYVGVAGFDFGEYLSPDTRRPEYFFAETNPRRNAADYPIGLMEHLNRGQTKRKAPLIAAFLSTNVKTDATTFSEFSEKCRHLLFNPQLGKGVFPYNTGCLKYGKCSVAVFGKDRSEIYNLYHDFISETVR